jgi:hypothetical protein
MLDADHNILYTVGRRKEANGRKAAHVITRSYGRGASRISAEFGEDVLIRYAITSQ